MADPTPGNGLPENPEDSNYRSAVGTFRPYSPEFASALGENTKKVGNEMKRKETEADKLFKALKDEGFEFTVNDKGEIENVEIPKSFAGDEEELRKKLEVKGKEASTLKRLLPISSELSLIQIQVTQITSANPAAAPELEKRMLDVKNLFDEALSSAEPSKAKECATKIEELKNYITFITPKGGFKTPDQEKIELQQEILLLSFDVAVEISESRALENEISDPDVLKNFKTETDRVEALFAALQKSINRATKDSFDQTFETYKKDKKTAEEFIQKNPKPIAKPAPTAAPTPAPTAAPKPPEPLKEYGGWPSSIYFRKQTKGVPGGWFSTIRNDLLLDQEAWGIEQEAFKIVFKKYLDFIRKLSQQERRFVKPLIDAKNAVVEAIKREDLTEIESLRETFDEAIETWSDRYKALKKLDLDTARFEEAKKKANGLPEEIKLGLKKEGDSIVLLVDIYKRHLEDRELSDEEVAKLETSITKYSEHVEHYKSIVYKPIKVDTAERDAAINGVWVKDYKTGQKKLVGFMKDTPTSTVGMSDEEKNRMIKVIGRPPMRNEDYINEQNAKKEEASKVTLTDELLDAWPELGGGYEPGDKIPQELLATVQMKATYERQYERDQNDFLRRYTIPSLDEKTNTVRYVESNLLLSQNKKSQEAIKALLQAKGIFVDIKNDAEIKADQEKEHKEKRLWTMRNSTGFYPRLKKDKGIFSKGDEGYRLGGYDPKENGSAKQAPESLDSSENRYEKLKRQRSKYLDPAVGYRFTELEQELDGKLAKAKKEQQDAGKDKKNWLTKYKLQDFQKALDAYEKDAKPLIEGKIAERKLPDTQIERQKRQDAIKRVNEILNIREKNLVKKPQYIRNYKLFCLALALALPPAALVGYKQAEAERGDAAVAAALQNTPTIQTNKIDKQEVTKTPKNPWKEFFSTNDPANKEFPDKILSIPDEGDARQQAIEQLTSSKVPEFMTSGDKSAIRTLLSLDADKIKNSKDHIPEFKTDKARIQAYEFVLLLEKLSQAIDNEAQVKARAEGKIYIAPSDTWYTSPKESLNSFIDRIQKKAKANS